MKSIAITFWGLVQIAGCSAGQPSVQEVKLIEAATAENSCVGDLSNWHREFYFQPAMGAIGSGVDKSVVTIAYKLAGHNGLAGGRFISETPTFVKRIDDSQHPIAHGRWDIQSHRLIEWRCGCNIGEPINDGSPPICPAFGS
ncbi:hypothetical protein [Sphingobium sp. Leaf26]|uniref:hypothetical protein n=1 Tax=Sphingobium sp. Leaf26 TaxID=1735693 RepID=UPI0012E1A31B|nr:hypothetical protein [Sphingobium sp. Leaf26]